MFVVSTERVIDACSIVTGLTPTALFVNNSV